MSELNNIKSNYLKLISETGLINEQEPAEVADLPDEPVDVADPQPVTTALSPESEVMYVRLLKKAMVMKLDPEDIDTVTNLTDVNENNAKDVLNKILTVMKSYSTEIDIDL